MSEFTVHVKRLLKTKWSQQSDTRDTERISNTEDDSSLERVISSKKSFETQGPGSRFESGREYTEQENVQYILPKDIQELDRLHQQHWMIKVAFEGNFEAPIGEELKKGITVLDSGCGPGTWTLEMAEDFPNSMFHGMDMAPVFPAQIKPPNCEFRLGNLNEKLPYPDNHFDYVHQRFLVAGLTAEGWEKALSELFRVLKPSGWIELKECQITLDNMGPLGKSLIETLTQVFKSKGFLPNIACNLGTLLEKNGFEEVSMSMLSIPINHGGLLGDLFWSDSKEAINSLKPLLVAKDPMTFGGENFVKAVEAIGAEYEENRTAGKWFSAYGRKPFD